MGIDNKRGQTAPPIDGSYRDPALRGKTGNMADQIYRRSPVGTKDISEIGYEPNGNVYERPDGEEVEQAFIDGGQYERPKEYQAPPPEPVFIESAVYPPFWSDTMYMNAPLDRGYIWPFADSMSIVGAPLVGGTLSTLLKTYTFWPAETMDIVGAPLIDGTLVTTLIQYLNWAPESFNIVDAPLLSGTLISSIITYSNWTPETMAIVSAPLTGGTLV